MRFTSEVIIDRPRQRVIELMTDPAHMSQWQPGIQSIEFLSGVKDQVGARSRVVFEMHGIRLEMIETVVRRNPPELFASAFEARGVKNSVENRFYEDGPAKTRWVMDNSFGFSGLMSVVGGFIQDILSKQIRESMYRFKVFAEHN
jgi:carbon monoxide dehydrogenase subunit G